MIGLGQRFLYLDLQGVHVSVYVSVHRTAHSRCILLYTHYTLLDFLQCNHTAAQFNDIAEEIILSPLYF